MSAHVHPAPISHAHLLGRKRLHAEIASHKKDPQNIIICRSMLDLWIPVCIFLLLVLVMVFGTWLYPESVQKISFGEVLGYKVTVAIPFFGLFPFALLGVIFHKVYDEKYVLTPDYILEVQGLCALKFHSARLRYIHIKDVELDQKLHQRFFDIGDLILATSITSGDSNIHMRGIANPRAVKEIIQARTKKALDGKGRKPDQETSSLLVTQDLL
jgi:hypothetical protein